MSCCAIIKDVNTFFNLYEHFVNHDVQKKNNNNKEVLRFNKYPILTETLKTWIRDWEMLSSEGAW